MRTTEDSRALRFIIATSRKAGNIRMANNMRHECFENNQWGRRLHAAAEYSAKTDVRYNGSTSEREKAVCSAFFNSDGCIAMCVLAREFCSS